MSEQDLRAGDGVLGNAARMVADAKVEIDQKCKNLESRIVGMKAQWQGQGGLAFQRLHEAWQEKQRRINNALNEFEQSLTDTERDNVATDSAAGDTYNADFSRLN